MRASLTQTEQGYIARFDRHWVYDDTEVWLWLTENDKLAQWFPELRVSELRTGGAMIFQMPDGIVVTMDITDMTPYSVLEFTWGQDVVRFELHSEPAGCHLVLLERLGTLTIHTPKDLAGWHVCLEAIHSLLGGHLLENRTELWKSWYTEYLNMLEPYPVIDRV